VVRLKGGDPFVFGRGGEECQALAEAGLAYEVVPGVSSAVAVPAYAGIPVTHRDYAASFTVVTGHSADPEQGGVDWAGLPATGTLVCLMGVGHLPEIARRLAAAGRLAETPAAVIGWGTTGRQVVVTGTLADIAERAAGVEAPATIVIGEVVGLRATLDWYGAARARAGAGAEDELAGGTPIETLLQSSQRRTATVEVR
jgi:siroheme synthase